MTRFILTLLFTCFTIGLMHAQSNAVTVQIVLYPIQILEVDPVIDLSKMTLTGDNGSFQHELPSYLSTYSTSSFILKVDYAPLFILNESKKPTYNEFAKPDSIPERSHQVTYSMETI